MKKKIYTKEEIDIERLSALARIYLTEDEKESFSCDLANAANYVSDLLVDVEAEYAREALTLEELREDEPVVFEDTEALLALSPDRAGEMPRVPRTVGGEKEER